MGETDMRKRVADERHFRDLRRRIDHRKRVNNYHSRRTEYFQLVVRPRRSYEDFEAPIKFSVLKNRAATIGYLKQVDKMLKNKIYTHVIFTDETETDLPTICLLGAYMLDYRTPSKYLEVTIPRSGTESRKIWDEVQFDRMIVRERRHFFSSGKFLSRSSNKVNDPAISDTLSSALKFFGVDRMDELRNLSPAIIEIIENTTLHAHPGKTSKIPWILNTRTSQENGAKTMEFCIVDLGIGVYDSIKDNVSKWNTTKAKVLHRLTSALDNSSTQSRFLAKNIPSGVGSSSNQATRGKGIKQIYEISQDKIYGTFDIITNKARVHLKDIDNIPKDAPQSMAGTIYYWTVRLDDEQNTKG